MLNCIPVYSPRMGRKRAGTFPFYGYTLTQWFHGYLKRPAAPQHPKFLRLLNKYYPVVSSHPCPGDELCLPARLSLAGTTFDVLFEAQVAVGKQKLFNVYYFSRKLLYLLYGLFSLDATRQGDEEECAGY